MRSLQVERSPVLQPVMDEIRPEVELQRWTYLEHLDKSDGQVEVCEIAADQAERV